MKRMIFLFVLVLSFFMFSTKVFADVCDDAHISQLKELAEQVDVSYEYLDNSHMLDNDTNVEFATNNYSIFFNLISDELYLSDGLEDYYYNQSIDGSINFFRNSGTYEFVVRSKQCAGYKLRSIVVKLPKFNTYSYTEECKKLKSYNLDVCNEWYQGAINDEIFYNEVNKYLIVGKNNFINIIVNFLKTNYLIVMGTLIVVGLVIAGIVVHRKRSVLE